jgi:hypothetical protein
VGVNNEHSRSVALLTGTGTEFSFRKVLRQPNWLVGNNSRHTVGFWVRL